MRLESDTFACRGIDGGGALDDLGGKRSGFFAGALKIHIFQERAQEHRRENISCSGIGSRLSRLAHPKAATVSVSSEIGKRAVGKMNTGDYSFCRSKGFQLVHEKSHVCHCFLGRHFLGIAIGRIGEKTSLGEIGRDHIRLARKGSHALHQIGGVGGIQLSVITHNGVDENQGALSRFIGGVSKAVDKARDCFDLLGTSQKTGIDGAEGGSQREERLDLLEKRMKECNLNPEDYKAYLDLRKYGGVIHSGFGLGFERMIMYLTGISNIRDVLPFPRTVGTLEG